MTARISAEALSIPRSQAGAIHQRQDLPATKMENHKTATEAYFQEAPGLPVQAPPTLPWIPSLLSPAGSLFHPRPHPPLRVPFSLVGTPTSCDHLKIKTINFIIYVYMFVFVWLYVHMNGGTHWGPLKGVRYHRA